MGETGKKMLSVTLSGSQNQKGQSSPLVVPGCDVEKEWPVDVQLSIHTVGARILQRRTEPQEIVILA